ncbi:MAG: Response regulator of the LytR/AlgR family, partial [Anaerocolumna sp.]|nr:Response regulator of the LytR/AlgR family [Anaerocolumna sp.]
MTIQVGICDDEEIILESLKEQIAQQFQITGMKYELHVFNNGAKLIRVCENIALDIVFLDIEMPLLNGLEVASRLREMNPFVHIIFVTNREDLVFSSFKYRPFRFIRKQRIIEELPEAVSHITEVIKKENQY